MLKQASFVKISRGLNKIRAKKYPKCVNVSDLDHLLKTVPSCREAFGSFRSQDFYQGLVKVGESTGSIFVCMQIVDNMSPNSTVYIDGTFGVLPLGLKQLLIIMADVGGKVRLNLFMD